MKLPRLLAAVLLFVSATGMVRANLGYTEAQCIAHYGAESDVQDGLGYHVVGDRAASFHAKTPQGLLLIRATFLNGLVCHEEISSDDDSGTLSQDRMKAILDSENVGGDWHKRRTVYRSDRSDTFGSVNWRRDDGAIATFWLSAKVSSQSASGEMELSTKQYADAKQFFDKEDGAN